METIREESFSSFLPLPEKKDQYTLEFINHSNAVVLKKSENLVTVGITEKTSETVFSTIKSFHSEPVEFVRISQVDLSSWLSNENGQKTNNSEQSSENNSHNKDSHLIDQIANDAPTVNLVNASCIDAIRNNASEIHIESGISISKVRYRIDGCLKTVRTFDAETFQAVSSRIKIMANLNILEKRLPQDGRVTVTIGNDTVDFRISIVPVTGGESIVMRILGKHSSISNLEELGFSKNQLEKIRSMIKIPHGLILVTGPTGSGKTTTLNAIMKELVSDETKIISIEDPVEFLVEGVNQIQINEQINLGFDSILRRVLRQDPNVIMVGEIRDKATAELSVRAALTGHLVLSTLHTNDAVSVITRLENMGIEPYLIASTLKGAIAQRLVRKYDRNTKSLKGRTVISETFSMDEKLESLITSRSDLNKIKQYLKTQGTEFLEDDAKNKLKAKITTLEEIQKEIDFCMNKI